MSAATTHPYNVKNDVNTHSPRVDANIIDAHTASGIMITTPMTAFAFPDQPAKMVKLLGDNQTGGILTWLGPVMVSVQDQYDNPVSNVDITFTIADPVDQSSCAKANQDNRPGRLISVLDPCMNQIPMYSDTCGSSELTEKSSDRGTAAQVMLGAMPEALYKVTASGAGQEQEFSTYSMPFGNCDDESQPEHALVLKSIYLADDNGQTINAGQTGSAIPLQARMYFFSEGAEEKEIFYDCGTERDDDDETCPVDFGDRIYSLDTTFSEESLIFDGQQASGGSSTEGHYSLDYQLPDSPGKHMITLNGSAAKKVNRTVDICYGCKKVEEDMPFETTTTLEVYAVEVQTEPGLVIPVDENGLVGRDVDVRYTILPLEYSAATAYVILYKNQTPVMYIPTELQGEGFATLPRGFHFELRDPDTNTPNIYEAEVVLNQGSGVEIRSEKIALHLITLELDADLNRDGIYKEDDPEEHVGVGLLIQANNDDDDRDGIVDYLDGFDLDSNEPNDDAIIKPDATPATDDDLVEVKLTGLPSDHSEGTVVIEVIKGQDKIRIWQAKEKGKDNILIEPLAEDAPSDAANPRKEWVLGADVANIAALLDTVYIEGVNPSMAAGDVELVTKYISPDGIELETDKLLITVASVAMVPDYNRDGVIDDNDRLKVTPEQPWRFWINDDDDGGSDPKTGLGGSDLPGEKGDLTEWEYDNSGDLVKQLRVNGIRDLVDFFPLHLDIQSLVNIFSPDDGYVFRIKNTEEALSFAEGIAGDVVLAADNAYDFLESSDLSVAYAFKSAPVTLATAEGQELSSEFLTKIKESELHGIILVEGRKNYQGALIFEIVNRDEVVFSHEFPVEITGVEQMFAHRDLRAVAGGKAEIGDRFVGTDSANAGEIKAPYCMDELTKKLVWMHGYNVPPEAARATYAEVFKRFFHAGFNGRFYGVSWYGDPPALGGSHYHQSVVNGFATAGSYAEFVNSLHGEVYVAGHSMGNMLVSLAINEHDLVYDKYFAIDAAVALEAYGQVNPVRSMMAVDDWLDYVDAGQSRLLASEWYKLFEDDLVDRRSKLTWRNRLDKVVNNINNSKVYNFYSETEEVLRSYEGDSLAWDGNFWNFKIYSWVKQEKFKGRRDKFVTDVAGGTSYYCGWSFNPYWFLDDVKRTPEEAVSILDLQLKSKPFFAPHLVTSGSLLEPSLHNLVMEVGGITPSDFLDELVVDTQLADYYHENEPAHDKITTRDWLLAEGFPATTLPAGANPNYELAIVQQNINMAVEQPDGCKTSENAWPRPITMGGAKPKDWHHSDYKDMAYQHVYPLYYRILKYTNP